MTATLKPLYPSIPDREAPVSEVEQEEEEAAPTPAFQPPPPFVYPAPSWYHFHYLTTLVDSPPATVRVDLTASDTERIARMNQEREGRLSEIRKQKATLLQSLEHSPAGKAVADLRRRLEQVKQDGAAEQVKLTAASEAYNAALVEGKTAQEVEKLHAKILPLKNRTEVLQQRATTLQAALEKAEAALTELRQAELTALIRQLTEEATRRQKEKREFLADTLLAAASSVAAESAALRLLASDSFSNPTLS